jgi:hypothetical protein
VSRHSSSKVPLEHLRTLWHEFVALPFPSGVAGTSARGVALETLDTDTCEIVERFLSMKGRLSEKDAAKLTQSKRLMSRVIPVVEAPVREYFTRLQSLTQHVLDEKAPAR